MVNHKILNWLVPSLLLVKTGSFVESTQVQVDDILPGIYFIKLNTGKTLDYKKIIKEKRL